MQMIIPQGFFLAKSVDVIRHSTVSLLQTNLFISMWVGLKPNLKPEIVLSSMLTVRGSVYMKPELPDGKWKVTSIIYTFSFPNAKHVDTWKLHHG